MPDVGALTLTPSDATARPLFGKGGKTPGPENPQELNRYVYVNNNPLNKTDPTGHCSSGLKGVIDGSCLKKAVAVWKGPRKNFQQNLHRQGCR